MNQTRKEQKENYEFAKDVKARIAKGEPTEFWERNIVKIYEKRQSKKLKNQKS